MPGLREDQFITSLAQLIEDFPEYAEILELLIEEIWRGRQAQITTLLQSLNDDEW